MRTYYRGPDASVTSERFVWRTSSPRIFAVQELKDVVLVRGNVPDRRPSAALLAALTLTILAVASWLLVGAVVGAAVGFVAVLAGAAALVSQPHRTVYEWRVRATYFGRPVVVYAAVDQRVFNQVTRALRRAREDGRPARAEHRLAA
jgi:hypothetical protein